MEESRRLIGFKRYDEVPSRIEDSSKESTKMAVNEVKPLSMSVAQVELVETIRTLANLIVSDEYIKFESGQKITLVKQLISSVSLDTELKVKTELLIS